MPRPKRNNKDVSVNPYQELRNDHIERNNQKLDALNLPRMNSSSQNVQSTKRTKRTHDAATEGHNLRRWQRNHTENANEQIVDPNYQPTENANELIDEDDLHNSPPKKTARSITRMNSFFARTRMNSFFEARAKIAKANRAKLKIHHTSGSKSFACSRHEMGVQLGRVPRRDEIYIKTHTPVSPLSEEHADANSFPVQWPYKRVKVNKASHLS